MEIELLTQADFTLNKCGRPAPPKGAQSSLYLPRNFTMQVVFPASTTTPVQQISKEITGDTTWCLRGIQISSSSATAISLQVLLPNGKFLISALQDAKQIAGYGSYRYAFTKELRCPPGSKIQMSFNVTDTTLQQPMAIEFSGAYQYLLKGGEGRICPVDEAAANLPRYFATPNQNIMAPVWQHGVSMPAPPGFRDEDYIYSALGPTTSTFPAGTPGSSISVTATNLSGSQQIQMDSAEFHVVRPLFQVMADNTVTAATVLARLRLGSGYAFCDDCFDVSRYIGSCVYPIDWIIPPNDQVIADLQVVDQAGTGNVYWTMFLDGFKRWRKA